MTLNESSLEKRFNIVSTSQGSIQSLSFFCLHYKKDHKKIAQIWLRCLQKAKVPHRLTLIYLANDIVQNAKRKNTFSFIDAFKSTLKDAVPYLRDEKIKKSVERVFSIWQDRNIFDSKFINELKGSLNDTGRRPQIEVATVNPIPLVEGDLIGSLTRLADIEKNERISIVDLKSEIDERTKLARLMEDSLTNQRKLLKECEDQLVRYKSQLDYITKLRDDLK